MKTLTKTWDFIKDMLGFRRNSKYVRTYLNDANIKSSIYMSFIIIVLEIWMIIRQLHEYIVPAWGNPASRGYQTNFELLFGMTSLYHLFILCSLGMLIFAISHIHKKTSNKLFIVNLVLGGLCLLWPFLMFLENKVGNIKGTTINIVTLYLLYFSMIPFGLAIIGNALYRKVFGKNNTILSIIGISCFAAVCLLFGIKVGYSDYISSSKPKMIICFLTMIIFVACLLIWKPYISIILLTSIFVGFLFMLKDFNPNNMIEGKRIWQEGDEINYITFLISLTMIAISIYQQRVMEAKKDEQLIHDAIFDKLIDVHNISYLSDNIKEALEENPAYYEDKIYLFINIMNFKTVNVQKGFEAGDIFLNDLALAIQKVFGVKETARLSDDRFTVLTSSIGIDEKINELNILVKKAADGLFLILKVGGYKPKPGDTTRRCIDKARYACNLIKTKYDVNYLEYDDEIDKRFNKRQYVVNHLEEAISKGWIKAYYQPVVWSKNKELCGAEALARWEDPVYGFMSPNEFVPVLEETRLVHKLDRYIVEYVCEKMREQLDKGKSIVPVSVNFSRIDFELMDVIEVLETNLKKYNIDKKYIHVEITESALSDDTDTLNEIISRLQGLGYAIWLDDFGSGYSSLNVLKDFKFDVVKIDMKFLTNFDTNEKTKDILDCIIQLADRLGMKTLTEGVETKEEAKFLEEIGCGRLQGFLFGKPYKLEFFEEKIESKELKISKKIL